MYDESVRSIEAKLTVLLQHSLHPPINDLRRRPMNTTMGEHSGRKYIPSVLSKYPESSSCKGRRIPRSLSVAR